MRLPIGRESGRIRDPARGLINRGFADGKLDAHDSVDHVSDGETLGVRLPIGGVDILKQGGSRGAAWRAALPRQRR